VFWAAYVLGPPLVTVLVTPIEGMGDGRILLRQLAQSVVGSACGLAIMHFLYAIVAPRVLTPPLAHWQIAVSHAAILVLGMILGAELTLLVAPDAGPLATPFYFRAQFYRFSLVYAGVMIAVLAAFDRLRDHALQKERERDLAEREARLAQLEALQIRTNPHFLFNALNTIAYLVGTDPEKAIESIERMSDLFRSILDFSSDMMIPLDEELDLVRGYLELEALRYEALVCNFAIDDDTRAIPVPALIVQPIVENAIKHGVARTSRPGAIEVRAERTGTHLCVRIINTQGDDRAMPHAGAGRSLDLIRERLSLAYGDEARLVHGPEDDGRYASAVMIPLRSRVRE